MPTTLDPSESDHGTELWAKCDTCSTVFKVADLPLDMREFGRLLRTTRCQCGGKRLRLPSAAEITTAKEKT